ncbi:uncharacterized protein [Bemisia tabaci]|uniref:uncharacterized protein isoform X1 n=1 Tax=Bemisia tabaci TaxID=7038 RepID=UPI003B28095A
MGNRKERYYKKKRFIPNRRGCKRPKNKLVNNEQQQPNSENSSLDREAAETLRATEELEESNRGENQGEVSKTSVGVHQETASVSKEPLVRKMTMAELTKEFPNLARVATKVFTKQGFSLNKTPKVSKPDSVPSKVQPSHSPEKNGPDPPAECPSTAQCSDNTDTTAEWSELMRKQQEAEQHQLTVERFHVAGNDPGIKKLLGRRIVDIQHIITEARKLEGHECRIKPNVGYFSFSHEVRCGLQSILCFKCTECGMQRNIPTTAGKSDEINSAGVKAITAMGKGHEPYKRFLRTLAIPEPTYGTFKKHQDRLKQIGPIQENQFPEKHNHVVLPAVPQHNSWKYTSGES